MKKSGTPFYLSIKMMDRARILPALLCLLFMSGAFAARVPNAVHNFAQNSHTHDPQEAVQVTQVAGSGQSDANDGTQTMSFKEDYNENDDLDDVSFLMLGAASSSPSTLGKKDGHDNTDDEDEEFCLKNKYRKRTLKVVKEMPFVGLFPELQRTRRFEGSGLVFAKGSYWVVFDSLRSLGQVDLRFSFRGPFNKLVGPVGDESQFEGIAYDNVTDTFLVVRESMEHEEHGLVPVTEELRLTEGGNNYEVVEHCVVPFALQDVNKGFESLVVFRKDGKRHMLGLCESNFCKTILGPDAPGLQRGNGRLVWSTYHAPEDEYDECRWEIQKVIHLPTDAYLLDYAAISFRGDFGSDVAVVSQEDAAVWVGTFDWKEMEFVGTNTDGTTVGRIYHFPRNAECRKIYCNVEGVAWIDAERLVVTSDKSKRIQDYRCMEKDQSLHIMALP